MPYRDPLFIQVGDFHFEARFEFEMAPQTCSKVAELLPFDSNIVQARWSGDAGWVPMGYRTLDLAPENAIHEPKPGQILFYPGGISEIEFYMAYGFNQFACKAGKLSGNHFATITVGLENLEKLGKQLLWEGAKKFRLYR
jgi:hypothetical protein